MESNNRPYRIKFTHNGEKGYDKLQKTIYANAIKRALNDISLNPFQGPNISKLSGVINQYKYRVGKYRIIYEIFEEELVVEITEIDSRGQVYKNL